MQDFAIINYALPILFLAISLLAVGRPNAASAPVVVLIGMWVAVLISHGTVSAFEIAPLYPSGMSANTVLVLNVISLAWSIMIWQFLLVKKSSRYADVSNSNSVAVEVRYSIPQWSLWLMASYALVVFFLVYKKASSIVQTGNVIGSLQLLRSRLNYDGESWGGLEYAATPTIVFSVYVYVVTRDYSFFRKIPFLMLVICTVGIAVISTQRTIIFMLLTAFTFSASRKALPSLRGMLMMFSAMLIAFFSVGFFVGKIGSKDAGISEVLQSGLDAFFLYFLTPISALDASLIWENSPVDAGYTFRFFQKAFAVLGFDVGEVKSLVMDFVNVPLPTNVYTFAYVAVSDFGPMFPLYFFLVGFLLAVAFLMPRNIPAVRVFQGFCYYPIVMTLYQDQFLTLTSSWVQILIVLGMCHLLTKARPLSGTR